MVLSEELLHVVVDSGIDIGLGAVLLRTHVGMELLGHGLMVDAQSCCGTTILVVFPWTATIVSDVLHLVRHLHLHAEAEHIWCAMGAIGL